MAAVRNGIQTNVYKVLVLEDEVSMNRGIAFAAEKNGFIVIQCFTVGEAKAAMKDSDPDVIVCDINLPDGSGLDFIHDVRQMESSMRPYIICLTALDTETDHVIGYEAGADDYVVKPFSLSVLMLKLEAIVRRRDDKKLPEDGKSSEHILTSGGLRFSQEKMEAVLDGRNVPLTRNECRLLTVFLKNPGQVLSREQILRLAFDIYDNYVDENTLAVNISRLREKLGDDAVNPVFIKNVRGLGYIWLQEVH